MGVPGHCWPSEAPRSPTLSEEPVLPEFSFLDRAKRGQVGISLPLTLKGLRRKIKREQRRCVHLGGSMAFPLKRCKSRFCFLFLALVLG